MKAARKAVLAITTLILWCSMAYAVPSAEFIFSETPLGGGYWQYDYTLYNTSDPVLDAGADIYDLFFAFDPMATLALATLPVGWDYISGSGFFEAFSLNPGSAPFGTDVAPGDMLSGFSFVFDYRAASIPFDVTLVNLSDPANPFIFSGVSKTTVVTPEPSMLLLLLVGFIGMKFMKTT